jgi:flagellum-specific ATP synthase
MATYKDNEDLITIGAYERGRNPKVDLAVAMNEKIEMYLKQDRNDSNTYQESSAILGQLTGR